MLRKNHADEQFLARRAVRDLPATIARYEKRLAALEEDITTMTAHQNDPIEINGRQPLADQRIPALGAMLDRIPDLVSRTQRFRLGLFHGLEFGVERHADGTSDVYLVGATDRTTMLAKESHGPRAVLNALNRLSDSYTEACEETRSHLTLARTQRHDFEARIGVPFPYADRLNTLTTLRDQLRIALSTPATTETTEPTSPTSAAIAEQIKALLSTRHTEADVPRKRNPTKWAERPITARSHRFEFVGQ